MKYPIETFEGKYVWIHMRLSSYPQEHVHHVFSLEPCCPIRHSLSALQPHQVIDAHAL